MAEPQIQDQPMGPATVHAGGAETAPVSTVPDQGTEPQVEVAPDLRPPEVPDDLAEAGVRYNTINPQVSQEAVEAGVSQSVPVSTDFAVPDFQTKSHAEKVVSQGPVTKGVVWQATEWIKNTLKLKKAA